MKWFELFKEKEIFAIIQMVQYIEVLKTTFQRGKGIL